MKYILWNVEGMGEKNIIQIQRRIIPEYSETIRRNITMWDMDKPYDEHKYRWVSMPSAPQT